MFDIFYLVIVPALLLLLLSELLINRQAIQYALHSSLLFTTADKYNM